MKALVMLAFVLVGVAEAAPGPQAAADVTDLTATVRGVDGGANTFEVVTGVGHALRVYSMKVGPSCEIKVGGGSATLGQLERGQLVRVRYRRTDRDKVAEAIETLPPPAGGGR